MQKRIIRKLCIERFLSQIRPPLSPKASLEQYTIPVDAAATMLYVAAYSNDDIIGKTVLDLGCGTGRLALGAAFLGAKQVVGVDIEKEAVAAAHEHSMKTGLARRTQWVAANISVIHGSFDTVLQNPPYGVQKRGADREFLAKALEVGKRVYSLHKSLPKRELFAKSLEGDRTRLAQNPVSPFLERFIEERGGRIKAAYSLFMTVPHIFNFHTRSKHRFLVDLYAIERM